MQTLKLRLVQSDLVWEDSEANLRHLTGFIDRPEEGEVVVLPEMFATGFTMQPEKFAQTMDGAAVKWMKRHSKNRVICGSLAIEENGQYYNRFIWFENGELKAVYNKHHLFSYGAEPQHYKAGNEKILIDYNGWKINPFVCYDLRFPVWSRNTDEAHLMIYTANWPEVRIAAWEKLLQARAIENQCWVAGVNRVGDDGNGIPHNGSTMLCNALGEVIEKRNNCEAAVKVSLTFGELMELRERFPVLKDRDAFSIDN
jgi:predicted amidohydrolase